MRLFQSTSLEETIERVQEIETKNTLIENESKVRSEKSFPKALYTVAQHPSSLNTNLIVVFKSLLQHLNTWPNTQYSIQFQSNKQLN